MDDPISRLAIDNARQALSQFYFKGAKELFVFFGDELRKRRSATTAGFAKEHHDLFERGWNLHFKRTRENFDGMLDAIKPTPENGNTCDIALFLSEHSATIRQISDSLGYLNEVMTGKNDHWNKIQADMLVQTINLERIMQDSMSILMNINCRCNGGNNE